MVASMGFGLFSPSTIVDNHAELNLSSQIVAYLISTLVLLKAHYAPSHSGDRKFSGFLPYDWFMGVELNPRFGDLWDFKLFSNGRTGMLTWTLINISFTYK